MANPAYLVFETGGTKLVAGVAGADCRIVETTTLLRQPKDRAEKSLQRLIEAGHELKQNHETQGRTFRACGFGFGGYVRRSTRQPFSCLHEEGWEDLEVVERLENEFQLPVAVENDCKLGALAEAHFGAGKGCGSVFYMTVGTGIGGGIVRDGHIQTMSDTGEAEIGHIVVMPHGPPCPCGGSGCAESVCSGPGMSQLAAWVADEDPGPWESSALAEHHASAGQATSKEILSAWDDGDQFAVTVVDRAADYRSLAMAAAINLIAPEVFVVGGGLGTASGKYLDLVGDYVKKKVAPCFRDHYRLAPSELGERVITQGAALLASQQIADPPGSPASVPRA
jgi:glucokinase